MEKFIGVKYASAERFCRPVPVPDLESIDGIDCKLNECPQPKDGHSHTYGHQEEDMEQSEDCLRLSIYTPDRNATLPVLIFIHGGSYITGSGQLVRYDSSEFAESEGIVVVSISYRLGFLGFMGGENLGLEDQVCALEWIRRNIHLFGGDGGRVTVMGQSSGAHSLVCHIASIKKPLFSKAIIMSAPFISKSRKAMERITGKFIKVLGCKPTQEATIEQIIQAQNIVTRTIIPGMPISPVCHNLTRPQDITPGLEKVIVMYQQDDAEPFSPSKYLIRLLTEIVFAKPSKILARHLRKKGVETEVVVRTWGRDMAKFGAIHFMEIPLLMGDWKLWKEGAFLHGISDEEYDNESRRFRKYIGNFVKS